MHLSSPQKVFLFIVLLILSAFVVTPVTYRTHQPSNALTETVAPFNRNVEKWTEVSELVYDKIESNPWLTNVCNWRVSVIRDHVLADRLDILSFTPPFWFHEPNDPKDYVPSAIIRVKDGYLVAYCGETSSANKIFWYSTDKSQKILLFMGCTEQFCEGVSDNAVYAGISFLGIMRFKYDTRTKKWESRQVVSHDFGHVFGISPYSKGGWIIFATSGWWKVDENYKVHELKTVPDITGLVVSIASMGNLIFLGGQRFVSEIDLESGRVRRLCPGGEYVAAVTTLGNEGFMKYVDELVPALGAEQSE